MRPKRKPTIFYAETLTEHLPQTFLCRTPEWLDHQVAREIARLHHLGQVRTNNDGSFTKRPQPPQDPTEHKTPPSTISGRL